MALLMKDLSKAFETFQSKMSGIEFNFKSQIVEKLKQGNIVEFADCSALECKHTFSAHEEEVYELESFVANDETFLVSASIGGEIKVWNLSNNTLVATLTGHTGAVLSMALYVQNGVQMLASGCSDQTIKLWDLSRYTNVHTLPTPDRTYGSLIVYERNCKVMLINGSWRYEPFKVWDLDNYTVMTALEELLHGSHILSVYTHDERMYLAAGTQDNKIKIWSDDDLSLVKTIDTNISTSLLVVVDIEEKKILLIADSHETIRLWSLNDYVCIKTIQVNAMGCYAWMGMLQCGGNILLPKVWEEDDNVINIWDLQTESIVKKIYYDPQISSWTGFMNGDQACLAIGDDNGEIKLWME